jgi:hypothetical protein
VSYGPLLTQATDAGRVVLSPLSPTPSTFTSSYNGALHALVTSTSASSTLNFEASQGGSFSIPTAAARNAFDTGWFPMRSQGALSAAAGAHNLLLEPEFLHVVALVRAVDTALAGFVFPGMGSGACRLWIRAPTRVWSGRKVGLTLCALARGCLHGVVVVHPA